MIIFLIIDFFELMIFSIVALDCFMKCGELIFIVFSMISSDSSFMISSHLIPM